MGQREGPETEVGGCVGDSSQAVLDGVDGLVDEHLSKLKVVPVVLFLVPDLAILGPSMNYLPISTHHLCNLSPLGHLPILYTHTRY